MLLDDVSEEWLFLDPGRGRRALWSEDRALCAKCGLSSFVLLLLGEVCACSEGLEEKDGFLRSI